MRESASLHLKKVALLLILWWVTTPSSWAVTSRIHRQSTSAQLLKGKVIHAVIGSRGTLQLGRAAEVLADDFEGVWSVNSLLVKGTTVYFGTSPNGGIYRHSFDTLTKIYPLETDDPAQAVDLYDDSNDLDKVTNEHVFALGMDMTGRLLAGFSGPACRLARFSVGGSETLFRPQDATYIFDIVTDSSGNIYLATGPEGKVYRLDPLGKTAQLVYDSRDKNILSLASVSDGFLYAGSDDRGLVYRLNPRDQTATVLYDSSKPEISSLLFADALDPSMRDLYAIATSARIVKREADFARALPPPGRPEPSAPAGKPTQVGKGGLRLQIANSEKKTSSKPPLLPPALRKGARPNTTSVLYRISREGYVTAIANKMAVFLCLAQSPEGLLIGTGNEGKLLRVDPVTEQQTVIYEDAQASQITSVARAGDGLFLGTANPAKLIRLADTFAREGEYLSDLIDAQHPAHWGKLQIDADVPAGCKVLLSARSGNVEDVNDPTFSEWSVPLDVTEPTPLECPLGRFCQYKLILQSDTGSATPLIREIAVSSTIPNLAPIVTSVDLVRRRTAAKRGLYEIRYKIKDDNDDELIYTLYFRRAGRTGWIELADKHEETNYEWDGRTVEDGRYEFRVVADDQRSNTAAARLTGSRISDIVVIDNTGPQVSGYFIEQRGKKTTLDILVRDDLSVIRKLDYAVDGHKEWQAAIPDDLVYDTTDENFTLEIEDLDSGDHVVTLRIRDDLGNVTYKSFDLDVADQ